MPRPPQSASGRPKVEESPLCTGRRRLLLPHLPAQLQLYDWTLRYSTEQHGCSLRTAYSRLAERGGSLLIVRDVQGHVFGGFASEPWHASGLKGPSALLRTAPHRPPSTI